MPTNDQVSWTSTSTMTDGTIYPDSHQNHTHIYTDNTSGWWTRGQNIVWGSESILPKAIQDSKFVGYLIVEDGFVCLYNSKKNEKHKLIDLNEQKMEIDVTSLIAKLLLTSE